MRCPDPLRRLCSWISVPIRPWFAEPKKDALAPYPEPYRITDLFLCAAINEFIKYRPCEPRFEAVTDENIGSRLTARSGLDAQRIVGAHRHKFVEISTEHQFLVAAFALECDLNREKRDVVDRDAAPLRRSDERIAAIGFAAQNGGEQLDERQAPNGRLAIIPSAVASDPHLEIAAINQGSLAGAWNRY